VALESLSSYLFTIRVSGHVYFTFLSLFSVDF
jgi:hypothetical protein